MPEPSTASHTVRTVHDPHATPHTQKRNQAVAWTIVITVGVVLLVLALSVIDGTDGEPLLHQGTVIQTLVSVTGVSGIVWPLLLRTSKDAAAVKDNVQNSHPGIMRDDMDHKHRENIGEIKALGDRMAEQFREVAAEFRGVRADQGRQATIALEQGKQIAAVIERQHETQRQVDELGRERGQKRSTEE